MAEAMRLARASGDVGAAAKAAGVSRSALYREMATADAERAKAHPAGAAGARTVDVSQSDDGPDARELDALVADLRVRLADLPGASPRVPGLAACLAGCLARRARMRPLPPPTAEEVAEVRRKADAETRREIERYVEGIERDAARPRAGAPFGVCVACGLPLTVAP